MSDFGLHEVMAAALFTFHGSIIPPGRIIHEASYYDDTCQLAWHGIAGTHPTPIWLAVSGVAVYRETHVLSADEFCAY